MIRKYHNHSLQTKPRHREEEPQYIYSNNTAVRKIYTVHILNSDVTNWQFILSTNSTYIKGWPSKKLFFGRFVRALYAWGRGRTAPTF